MSDRKAGATQAAGLIGVNHGGFLFDGVSESAAAVTFQNGVINSSHIRQRYDCYAMLEPEASGGASDYAYDTTDPIHSDTTDPIHVNLGEEEMAEESEAAKFGELPSLLDHLFPDAGNFLVS